MGQREMAFFFCMANGLRRVQRKQSHISAVLEYIHHQEHHHRKLTFQEEFIRFLKKYEIEYDERYIWQ